LEIKELISKFAQNKSLENLLNDINDKEPKIYHLNGLYASSASFYFLAFLKKKTSTNFIILGDREEASYFYNDLLNISGNEDFLFFPSSFKRSVQFNKIDSAAIIQRTDVFNKIASSSRKITIVTYTEALAEKVITENELAENTLQLGIGDKLSIEFVNEVLIEYNFKLVDFVFEPGQYSIRGSIIDIFSFSNDNPFRIDFFGNEIESIRTFDIVSQLSKAKFERIAIIPDIQNKNKGKERISIFNFLPKGSIIWTKDAKYTQEKLTAVYQNIAEKKRSF
jgi:transcription-repair coupling factor (superfamily II helicase)